MDFEVFISYSSKDRQFATALKQHLTDLGVSCWIDQEGIGAGEDWTNKIGEALRQVYVLVLVYSSNSINSDNVQDELAMAAKRKLAIVPVRIEDIEPSAFFEMRLARYNWIDIFDMQQSRLKEIAESIKMRVDNLKPIDASVKIDPQDKNLDIPIGGSSNTNIPVNVNLNPSNEEVFQLIAGYIRAVFNECSQEALNDWWNSGDYYDSENFSIGTKGELVDALTKIYLHYCAPVTKISIVATFDDILSEANLSEACIKAVCKNIGIDSTGRKNDLIERLEEEFAKTVDKTFPKGRDVYSDNPDCPNGLASLIDALVNQLSMDQLKDWIDEFNIDSTVRRNSRKDMADALCRVYRCYVPDLSHNGRIKFFASSYSQLDEQQIKNICQEIRLDVKGRKKELIGKLILTIP